MPFVATRRPETGISVREVAREDAPLLRALLDDYLSEFARSEGVQPDLDKDGRPDYPWFERYWDEAGRLPLGFWSGRTLVGFCLVRDDGEAWQIAEFYVAPRHRRRGIGSIGVESAQARCRMLGSRHQLRADVRRWNHEAYRFWVKHGFQPRQEDEERTVLMSPL